MWPMSKVIRTKLVNSLIASILHTTVPLRQKSFNGVQLESSWYVVNIFALIRPTFIVPLIKAVEVKNRIADPELALVRIVIPNSVEWPIFQRAQFKRLLCANRSQSQKTSFGFLKFRLKKNWIESTMMQRQSIPQRFNFIRFKVMFLCFGCQKDLSSKLWWW